MAITATADSHRATQSIHALILAGLRDPADVYGHSGRWVECPSTTHCEDWTWMIIAVGLEATNCLTRLSPPRGFPNSAARVPGQTTVGTVPRNRATADLSWCIVLMHGLCEVHGADAGAFVHRWHCHGVGRPGCVNRASLDSRRSLSQQQSFVLSNCAPATVV